MLRRTAPALVSLLLAMPGVLSAQYFGRNKVQYTSFDFKVIQTEHFDVYFYERERVAAMDAARMAERSYARLSKVLNHEFKERKPIILYASHSDFMQTNATQVGGRGHRRRDRLRPQPGRDAVHRLVLGLRARADARDGRTSSSTTSGPAVAPAPAWPP